MLVENRFQLKNLCHSVYKIVQSNYTPQLNQSTIRERLAHHFGYKSYASLSHDLPSHLDLSLASSRRFLHDLAGAEQITNQVYAEMLFRGVVPNGLHQSPEVHRFCSGCGHTLPRTAMRKEITGDYFHHAGQTTRWYCPCGELMEVAKEAAPESLCKYLKEVMIPESLERSRKDISAEVGGFKDGYEPTQNDLDNHSNQMNPNNDAYWDSRGEDGRPDDWEERVEDGRDDKKTDH